MFQLDRRTTERFLQALANIQDDDLRSLLRQFPQLLPDDFLRDSPLSRLSQEMNEKYVGDAFTAPTTPKDVEEYSLGHLMELRMILRKAWRESDPRLRKWYAYDLSRRFHRMMNPDRENEPPDATPFEQACYYFRENHQRARYCQNPECFTPYYIASHLKPTRFCNSKCAAPAQRAAKLEWWNRHKEEMLKRRKTQKRKKAKR